MSEPVLAVFHATSMPGHPANPDTDQVIEWPRSPSGVPFMPMSGSFVVQGAGGSQQVCTDGFLTIDADGHPVWSRTAPG